MKYLIRITWISILFAISISAIFVSCDRDDENNDGPYIEPRIAWSEILGDMEFSSLAMGADNIIYFAANNKLLAYTTSGMFVWECALGNNLESPVLDQSGNIYVQDKKCNLYAVSSDGQKKWEFKIDLPYSIGYKMPAIGPEGNVYIVGDSVYAFNSEGTKLWSYFPEEYHYFGPMLITTSTPTVGSDGTVYIVLHPEHQLDLVALNQDGTEKWHTIITDAYYCVGSITIGQDGTLYFPGETGDGDPHYLYAYTKNGDLKWRIEAPYLNRIRASVSIGEDGTLYIGTKASDAHEAVFMALDPDNGQIYWEFITERTHGVPDDIYVSATIGKDGIIYFSCENSILYALNNDGTEEWRITFDSLNGGTPGFSCPVIDMNGLMYQTVFGSEGGLYAITTDSKGLANTPWPKFRRNNANSGRGSN